MSCYIIAEAGVNHNGDVDRAKQLIDVAKNAGADAVKFQTFHTDAMVTRTASKAQYQQKSTGAHESQRAMLKKLELDVASHHTLKKYADELDIEFLSTPFDFAAVDLLVHDIQVKRLKVSSGDLSHGPLLLKMARSGLPLIVSTGMATLEDIERALQVIAFGYLNSHGLPTTTLLNETYTSDEGKVLLQKNVTVLHCTTQYPTPLSQVNLRAMDTLRQSFHLPVGYSDHTQGIHVSLAAVARGACVIEKHFTLDKNLPGPDHAASLEPDELCAMVRGVREIEQALGVAQKQPSPEELANKQVACKKVVALQDIVAGDLFSSDNLTCKRAEGGVSAMTYWTLCGQKAKKNYMLDEVIEVGEFIDE